MQYTGLIISTLAFISIFKWSDAKRMSDDEARRKLYTLAELLDAEIAARAELAGKPLKVAEDSQPEFIEAGDELEQYLSGQKPHRRLTLTQLEDLFPAQNAKRSSNLLRLANQSARGFGK